MKNGGVLQQYVYFTILIFIKYNANSTYLFKLKRLLHYRVNPTVQLLRKKESIFKQKRANRNKTNNVPPIGSVGIWTGHVLGRNSLEQSQTLDKKV